MGFACFRCGRKIAILRTTQQKNREMRADNGRVFRATKKPGQKSKNDFVPGSL